MKKLLFTKLLLGLSALSLISCASDSPINNGGTNIVTPSSGFKIAVKNPYTPAHLKGKKLVRVALLAPFSSTSGAIKTESEILKNATQMALEKYGDGQTVVFNVDSGETAETAAMAAKSAIAQGADFILGPLFSSGVHAVAPYARANGTTLFSFSTDTSDAGNGIFVLSFLPEDEAYRIISFAAKKGIKNVALILPVGKFGDRVESAAQMAAKNNNIKIVSAQKYDSSDPKSMDLAAKTTANIAKSGGGRNNMAVFIPERGNILKQLVKTLDNSGANASRVQLLGTGIWNDTAVKTDSRMYGAWFVATESEKRADFASELKAKKNMSATRFAGLGYDAMTLIAQNAKNGEKNAISSRLLERNKGFDGIDGRFRFNDGIVERSMPIMEIEPSGLKIIDAAPKEY